MLCCYPLLMRWKLAYIFALVWVMFCAPAQLWSYAVTQPTIAWRQTYTYDAMGRRVSRTTYQNEVASTTVYVSADMQEVAEYTDSSDAAVPTKTYVYGSYVDEPVQVRVFASATTQPASTQNATTQPSFTDYYYHTNALYSVIAVSDTAGTVVERYTYDAYGQRTITDADGAPRAESILGNEIGFTGRRLDPLTNQYYFRARYYDAAQGRFISRDPLEYVDGMSLYGGYYVPNGLDAEGAKRIKLSYYQEYFLDIKGIGFGFWNKYWGEVWDKSVSVRQMVDDIKRKIGENIDKDGECGNCIELLYLYGHGEENFLALSSKAGEILDGNGDFADRKGADGTSVMEDTLKELRPYFCDNAMLEFVSCKSGAGAYGRKMVVKFAKLLGVQVRAYTSNVMPGIEEASSYRLARTNGDVTYVKGIIGGYGKK